MGNNDNLDFLSTIGLDWPEYTITEEPCALPVLEDDLSCLQPSSHAADDLIRDLMHDDLCRAVLGTSNADLAALADHDQLLKRAECVDASLQRMQEIGELIDSGLSKSTAELVASTPPTRLPVIPTRPPVIPTRPTPLHPVHIPRTPSRHRAPLEKLLKPILAKVFPMTDSTRYAWNKLLDSAEDFVIREVASVSWLE